MAREVPIVMRRTLARVRSFDYLRLLRALRTPSIIFAGALLGVAATLLILRIDPPSGRYNDDEIRGLAQEQVDKITPTPPLEPLVYASVRPSVVTITRDPTGNQIMRGLGSGVVVDASGVILTAYHVVAGADTVGVRFYDGSTAVATVGQVQPDIDLAVVQVRRLPQGVQPATLGGSVHEGDQVMAIGAPFGLEGSASSGVVSALGRSFTIQETGRILTNMIQFDAAVNPGNSGGPLVDMRGRVVGIVTGIVNPTGQEVFVGLGFATPIQAASGIFAPLG